MSGDLDDPHRLHVTPPSGGHARAWLGIGFALFPVALTVLLSSSFVTMYASFGADFPALGALVLRRPVLLASLALAMALWRLSIPGGLAQARTLFWMGITGGGLLSILTLLLFYLPILSMAGVL